jgi:hypothetical protein
MLDRTFYIVRNPMTGEVVRSQLRDGRTVNAPKLYIDRRRARQGLSMRADEVSDTASWEIVPVQLKVTYDGR